MLVGFADSNYIGAFDAALFAIGTPDTWDVVASISRPKLMTRGRIVWADTRMYQCGGEEVLVQLMRGSAFQFTAGV